MLFDGMVIGQCSMMCLDIDSTSPQAKGNPVVEEPQDPIPMANTRSAGIGSNLASVINWVCFTDSFAILGPF